MNGNPFIDKFKSKPELELERIAMDSKSFVFEARYAAATILKNRNFHSAIIETVEEEGKNLEIAKKKNIENLKQQDRALIRRIRNISIKGTGKYRLENGNELQVKRLNEGNFQVRIEDNFRSALAPVMICKIKDESTYLCYPFLYLKSILIYGIGGMALTIVLYWLGYVKNETLIFFLPLMVTIGLQLLVMPFIYYITLGFFRERLRKK